MTVSDIDLAAGATASGDDHTRSGAARLNEREQAILAFEATWFTLDEDRYQAIRSRFQCSYEEYALELNTLIDLDAALAADPLVVRRLRRARDRRRRSLLDGAATAEQPQQ